MKFMIISSVEIYRIMVYGWTPKWFEAVFPGMTWVHTDMDPDHRADPEGPAIEVKNKNL